MHELVRRLVENRHDGQTVVITGRNSAGQYKGNMYRYAGKCKCDGCSGKVTWLNKLHMPIVSAKWVASW